MGNKGLKRVWMGAVVGVALLAGCEDGGRSAAMRPQQDYLSGSPWVTLHRGSTTGLPMTLPVPDSGMGGSGMESQRLPLQADEVARNSLWQKQDFRVPYAPPQLSSQVAMDLGTGKALKANAQGVWVQGVYGVEVGSGLARVTAPASAPYQPQRAPVGNEATPQLPLVRP